MQKGKWTVEPVKSGGKFFYRAIKLVNGGKVFRGDLYDNRTDAERLAETLNREEAKP